MDDALAFCRRRLDTAIERTGDLRHVSARLRDDDEEAERVWSDAQALDLRGRHLTLHREAAGRQLAALDDAVGAGRDVLTSLGEASRLENLALQSIAAARAATQDAQAAIGTARHALDTARVSIQTAESECAGASAMLAGL